MKLSTAFFIILVILLGALGVASSASDFEHHEFLRRKEKKFVLNETENSSNKSVDLTKTGYYSKNCYGPRESEILIEDCLKLQDNIKNNTEIIKCGPACSMYVHYKSCAVFLMVMESAKKDYRISTYSLNDTIAGTLRNCHKNKKEKKFTGGWYSFNTPENIEWEKQNPSSSDYPPIITAVAATPT
ncbi:expressed protein [Phakopsora pachyrhizi]|uniref:Expressed protein n=1 Tax=Phakopsora pachyrhizi TaxID=170000 RepID=A0AAV0AHV2_PHAPC|nr:expressed protein [Phakopsora pachyrhizi]